MRPPLWSKNLYGFIREQYSEGRKQLRKQLAKAKNTPNCFICDKPCVSGRELAIDHCHQTGQIRGLLCTLCNCGLGSFRDNVSTLKAAIRYLKSPQLGELSFTESGEEWIEVRSTN